MSIRKRRPSFDPFQLFARGRRGAWLEPRTGYMWQENTGATPTTTGGQTVGKLVDLTAARVASQSTAANRPIYGVRRNLLTYSEDFSQSVWTKASCTIIASNATAPDGSNTAATFRFLNASYAEVYQGAGKAQLAGVLRLGFYTIWIRRRAGSGQVRLKTPTGTGYTDINPTEQWQKFTSATANPYFSPVEYYPGINLNELGGELDIWHPYMTFADAPDDFGGYQRITTATDYDPGPYPALAHGATGSLSVALPAINVRRNLLTYSEQFDNAVWQNVNISAVLQGYIFGMQYYKITATNTSAYAYQGFTPSVNNYHTLYAYVKKGNYSLITLKFSDNVTFNYFAVFNFDTMSFVSVDPNITSTNIQQKSDGWIRISATYRYTVATGNVSIDLHPFSTQTIGNYFLLAGAQLELGSVATDYQKITDWTSEQYSSAGSVYFATPQGMSCLHNQSIGTAYTLPAVNSEIYGWCVFPERLTRPEEAQLERYFLRLAGISGGPDYLLDDDYNQLTDDAGELLLRA